MNEAVYPMVSIIVPVYNAEEYLDSCVESICKQTYRNLEIILVDDGSGDSSGKICDEWQRNDLRIHVIHKSNGGASSARNAGLEVAKGDYIGFVDADDVIAEDMYEQMIAMILRTGADVAHCDYYTFPEKENDTNELLKEDAIMSSEEVFSFFLRYRGWAVWSTLYPQFLWETERFDNAVYGEDALIFTKIAKKVDKWAVTPKKLYGYNTGNTSITRSEMTLKHLGDIDRVVQEFVALAKNFPEKYEDLLYDIYSYWLVFFNLALQSSRIGKKELLAKWKEMLPNVRLLEKTAFHTERYKAMRIQTKIRWWGFRVAPFISQKVYSFLTGNK